MAGSSPVRPTISKRSPTRGNAFSDKTFIGFRAQYVPNPSSLRGSCSLSGGSGNGGLSHALGGFESWERAGFGVDGLGVAVEVQLLSRAQRCMAS